MPQMLDFRERSRLRRALYAKPTIIALCFLTILVARAALGMHEKSIEAQGKRDKATEELGVLEARERELREDILRLSNERGQEEEIRDRFMVAKDGEKVIIVAESEEKKDHSVTVVEDTEKKSFLERLRANASGQ